MSSRFYVQIYMVTAPFNIPRSRHFRINNEQDVGKDESMVVQRKKRDETCHTVSSLYGWFESCDPPSMAFPEEGREIAGY